MSTKTHLAVLKAMFVAFFVEVGAAVVAVAQESGALGAALIWLGVADFIFMPIVLLAAPVQCNAPGCEGWMKRNFITESSDMTHLKYECRTCHHIVDTNLCFGGSDPWW